MIDVAVETPIPLNEARTHRLICAAKGAGGVTFLTMWRWATAGVRGNRLEVIRIGKTLCTTDEAIVRFFNSSTLPPAKVAEAVRAAQRQSAAAILDAAGM